MSVPVLPQDDEIPTFRSKRLVERRLMSSKVPYTIFRASLFMDDWFALMGSSIPLRGAEAATLERPFWFSRAFMKGVGHLIENHGLALVPGSGQARHAFITLDDVASFLVKAVGRKDALNRIYEIGGPEVLSWKQVVALYEKVLGRRVRGLYAPAVVFRLQQMLLSPFSPAAGNLMAMNWAVGTSDTLYDMGALAPEFGISLTTGEQFLRAKARLPAQ
jgi:NADH dehydrogenase